MNAASRAFVVATWFAGSVAAQQAPPARTIPWAPVTAPSATAPFAAASRPIVAAPGRAASTTSAARNATVRLSDVLALPASRSVPTAAGTTTTAGDIQRRYADWLTAEVANRRPAAPMRVARTGTALVPHRGGVIKTPGAAIRAADAQMIGELRALPCSGRQSAYANGSAYYLSSVNRRAKDYWIDLDADERILVLSGCFDRKPGEVRVSGRFDKGQLTAKVISWEETVIIAQVPALTGIADQDIGVRAVLANGQSTNERLGHLWARRESRKLDDLTIYTSSGACQAQVVHAQGSNYLVARDPPKYPLGTTGPLVNRAEGTKTCSLPGGETTPRGTTRFKARLPAGWEVMNLSLAANLGSARHQWVGDTDFDVQFEAASFVTEHRFLGILTETETFYALDFRISDIEVRGPVGTWPMGR